MRRARRALFALPESLVTRRGYGPLVWCCAVSRVGAYAVAPGRPPSSAAGAPDAVPGPAVRGAVPGAHAGSRACTSRARDSTRARSIVHFVHICLPIAFSFRWRNDSPKTDASRYLPGGSWPGRHREAGGASLGVRRETAPANDVKNAANFAKRCVIVRQRASNARERTSNVRQSASSVQAVFPIQWVRPARVAPGTAPGNRRCRLLNPVDGSRRQLNGILPGSADRSGFRDVRLESGNLFHFSTARGALREQTQTRDRLLNGILPGSAEWSGFREARLESGNPFNPSTARGALREQTQTRDRL